MNRLTSSNYESALITILSKNTKNAKYNLKYHLRILKYAKLLHIKHGGDIDVISVLCLLIGYRNIFFEFNKNKRPFLYQYFLKKILKNIKLPKHKSSIVQDVLKQFYKRDPKTIEEKILSDSIILGSIDSYGIIRYFLWQETYNQSRLDSKNFYETHKENFNKLFFQESINIAEKNLKFAYFFLAQVDSEPCIGQSYNGKYIILEGNSGTGKTTQAKILKQKFEELGKNVTIVEEPTKRYKEYENFYESKTGSELSTDKLYFRLYSIIGDRCQQINDTVLKELEGGNIVISTRSSISMLVYQCENDIERLLINYIHTFLPRPDIVILLDVDVETCLERIKKRGSNLTMYDKRKQLTRYRPIYKELIKSYYFDFPIVTVNASGSETETSKIILDVIKRHISILKEIS